MATIQGTGGNAVVTGFGCKIYSWNGTLEATDVDTTGFADSGFRTCAPAAVSFRGSAVGTGYYNGSNTAPLGDGVTTLSVPSACTITLTASSGHYYTFQGLVSGVRFTRPVDGKLDITFDFESTGAVTQGWS